MPERGLTWADLRNAILFGALVYLIIRFIGQTVDVLLVFSIIALVVVTLDPIVTYMHTRHKVPRPVSTGILALLFIASVVGLLYYILPVAGRQVMELTRQAPTLVSNVQGWFGHLADRYPSLRPLTDGKMDLSHLEQYVRPFLGGVTTITESAFGLVAAAILIFVSTIYTLNNPAQLTDGFLRAIAPKYRDRAVEAGHRMATQVRAWSLAVVLSMISIFLLTWIALSLLGFKQAFLFAVIAGLLEAVPIIGPILGGVLPTIVALITNPILALYVIGVFVIIQQIENHVLVPQIMSRSLALHPVTVIFWVLVMGGIFGIIGIFLATPVAVAAGILYDELYLCGIQQRCEDSETLKKIEEQEKEDENSG